VQSYLQTKYFGAVGGGNNPPVANADTSTVMSGDAVTFSITSNDTDSDGTVDDSSVVIVSNGTQGTATYNGNGTVTYVHTGGGNSDTFEYTVNDDSGETSNVATVTMTIVPVGGNNPPVANADAASVESGNTVTIDLTSNDTDSDGTVDDGSVLIMSPPAIGTVFDNEDGTVDYTHVGPGNSDAFEYTVDDNDGESSNVATVTLSVTSGDLPIPDTGLAAYFEADMGVSVNGGGVVSAWADQSGTGNNLTGSGNPVVLSGELNGNPVIAFDGVGDALKRTAGVSGLSTGASDRTMFVVAKYDGAGYGGVSYGAAGSVFGLGVSAYTGTPSTAYLSVFGWGTRDTISSEAGAVNGVSSGWMVQSVVVSGNTMRHYQDGVQIGTRSIAYNTSLANLVLGQEIDGAPSIDMNLAAVAIYDRALSAAERAQVQSYLQAKYFGVGG
jgi:hypothetical protein